MRLRCKSAVCLLFYWQVKKIWKGCFDFPFQMVCDAICTVISSVRKDSKENDSYVCLWKKFEAPATQVSSPDPYEWMSRFFGWQFTCLHPTPSSVSVIGQPPARAWGSLPRGVRVRGRLPVSPGCWGPPVSNTMRVPGQVLRPEPPCAWRMSRWLSHPCTRDTEAEGQGRRRWDSSRVTMKALES